MVKTMKCYKSEHRKLMLAIPPEDRPVIISALSQLGCKPRWGRAPRGAAERELEVWLAKLLAA